MKSHRISFQIVLLLTVMLPFYGFGQVKVNYNGHLKTVSNYDENKAHQYIDNSTKLDDIEGVWVLDNFRYFIQKEPGSSYKYRAIILDAGGNMIWKPGYIRFYLEKTATDGIFQMTQFVCSDINFRTNSVDVYPEKNTFLQTSFGMAEYSWYNDRDDSDVSKRGWQKAVLIKMYPFQPKVTQNLIEQPSSWSGSGFALNDGYLVTNYHVIEDAKTINIKGIKGNFNTTFEAEIIASDKINDLALLKIKDSRFTGFGTIPYKVKTTTSEVGEDIFVLGYPLTSTMGDEIKLTTGVISSKTGFQGDVSLYQISAPVQPGNSGGPLFDGKGNLIGVVSSKHSGAENVGYAIKASYLNNLVESAVSSKVLPQNNTISGQPLTGKVKTVKDFVFLIECSK